MRSAHDDARAAQILSRCRPVRLRGRGRVCSACGQSWPCMDYTWAALPDESPPRWTWRDLARATALIAGLGIAVPAVTARLLPVEAWAALVIAMPVVIVVVLVVAAGRRAP